MKKLNRLILILMLFIMPVIGACSHPQTIEQDKNPGIETETRNDVGAFKVAALDVGKADAFVLMTENFTVLIDTGVDKKGDEIVEYLESHNIDKIDYMIITHFDKDHVGGADIILEQMEVEHVIQPKYQKSSKQYIQYAEAMLSENIVPVSLTSKMEFTLDAVNFVVLPPKRQMYEKENDYSLVVSVRHGENSFLFAGDAMAERLEELLKDNSLELEHQFLKVPHHGGYNERSEEFLKAVQPNYAVITSSSDERPVSEEILDILEEMGTEVYFTEDGNFIFESDGETIVAKEIE